MRNKNMKHDCKIYTVNIYIQLWSELLAPLVNMIKDGYEFEKHLT